MLSTLPKDMKANTITPFIKYHRKKCVLWEKKYIETDFSVISQ